MWFLLIPPVTVLLGLLWLALAKRPDRSRQPGATMETYRRTMAALARPIDPTGEQERGHRGPFTHHRR